MKPISEKKQKLIDEFLASPVQVGEVIGVKAKYVSAFSGNDNKIKNCKVLFIGKNKIEVVEDGNRCAPVVITKDKIEWRATRNIGACPMVSREHSVRFVALRLDSILFNLGIIEDRDKYTTKSGHLIKRSNFNPFVYDKDGNKQYYQRPFVWTLEEKQLLIESMYQRIECGRILVRKRSWEECELMGEEAAFIDIVDGKQRLNAVQGFLNDEYPDMYGNFYSDLSTICQSELTNHQLFSYAEMDENTPDNKIIEQFLKLNFAGVPQSKEHIEFVKSINI